MPVPACCPSLGSASSRGGAPGWNPSPLRGCMGWGVPRNPGLRPGLGCCAPSGLTLVGELRAGIRGTAHHGASPLNPGRCPGLTCFAPSGLTLVGELRAGIRGITPAGARFLPGRCPGRGSFAPSGLHGGGGLHLGTRGVAPGPGALPRADLLRPFRAMRRS